MKALKSLNVKSVNLRKYNNFYLGKLIEGDNIKIFVEDDTLIQISGAIYQGRRYDVVELDERTFVLNDLLEVDKEGLIDIDNSIYNIENYLYEDTDIVTVLIDEEKSKDGSLIIKIIGYDCEEDEISEDSEVSSRYIIIK